MYSDGLTSDWMVLGLGELMCMEQVEQIHPLYPIIPLFKNKLIIV